VSYFRWQKGQSPFLGSKDHFALRLEYAGWTRSKILLATYTVAVFLSVISFVITIVKFWIALFIYLIALIISIIFAVKLGKIKVAV